MYTGYRLCTSVTGELLHKVAYFQLKQTAECCDVRIHTMDDCSVFHQLFAQILFSCVFVICSVSVTWMEESLTGLSSAVLSKPPRENLLCSTSSRAGPACACLLWCPSVRNRKLCEVFTRSWSSCDISDGQSWEMMEEERPPSAQRKRLPSPRCLPPILQNRHLIFCISLRTTVFLSRM